MPPPDSGRGYRPTALDRALSAERTIAVVGPVAGIDEKLVRANLRAVLADAPEARIALAPRPGVRSWRYRSDMAEQAVVRRCPVDANDLGDLLTQIGAQADRGPLDVYVCDDYLAVDYSHGIGDGQLGLTLLAVLSADVDPERAGTLANGLPRNAVWTALRRHYGAHPGSARDFLRLRKRNRQAAVGPDVGHREIRTSDLSKQSRAAHMNPTCVTALRTWARSHADGASSASVTVALWIAALRGEGVSVDDRITMLVNCRRYLDPSHQLEQGNFAVALPLWLPQPQTPATISTAIREVIESGWPIAILGMAELKAMIARGAEEPPAETLTVPDRLRVAVSDLGRLGMFDHTDWATGAPPQVAAYLEPAGPDATSLLVSELAGGRTFTASFCGAMVEPAVIERALHRMCDDPVGTLQPEYG